MLAAIRRTKSVPLWLALIAALTVIGTLATIVVSSVMQSHTSNPVGAAAQDGKAAAATAPAALAAQGAGPGTTSGTAAGQATPHAIVPATQTSSATSAPSSAAGAVARADTDHPTAASRAHLRAAANARAAARRDAAITASRGDGTLRADIARYNAERGAGFDRRKNGAPIRAASDGRNLHSLWDEMPQTMSDVYKN